MDNSRHINAYLTVFSARFRMMLQYRAAAWAGFGTQTFFGLVRVMVFTAFFASSASPQPMNFPQVISYIWLGQALFAMIPFREDTELAYLIRSGNIVYELVRPVKLFWFWLARQIATRSAPVMLRATPMLIVAAGLFPLVGLDEWALRAPSSWQAFPVFLCSLAGALLLACMFSMLMTISLFWTISADGVATLLPILSISLCGIVIPLPFFPDWMQPLLQVLPFRGIMDVPFQIYVGSIAGQSALWEIGRQWGWILAIALLNKTLLQHGLRRVVVQGG